MFASCVAVSDAYMHVIGYGQPVEILGLEVHNGDLLYADCHGAISIPPDIVGDLAEVAARISTKEARIVEACLSPDLSREELLKIIQSGRSS
jgi:regulator of RNase E activity RraA